MSQELDYLDASLEKLKTTSSKGTFEIKAAADDDENDDDDGIHSYQNDGVSDYQNGDVQPGSRDYENTVIGAQPPSPKLAPGTL